MQFYYHPNHLGSSSYITNLDGEVSQRIEYVPFGEVFIDELELMRKSATAGKPTATNVYQYKKEKHEIDYGKR
ncbi:hypothetical protein DEM91_06685 [Prevotella sp. TCVGH]|uniref:hypothetical protein n=1 Tax=Prevotella sp. TCVGH TaxID=2182433 RepID=UPI00201DAEC9|nr:hypothetical protein [Prevotella sp. TCVGH]MCL6748325.1 hypothetical protein [Prevotella sp. TCVGH]